MYSSFALLLILGSSKTCNASFLRNHIIYMEIEPSISHKYTQRHIHISYKNIIARHDISKTKAAQISFNNFSFAQNCT